MNRSLATMTPLARVLLLALAACPQTHKPAPPPPVQFTATPSPLDFGVVWVGQSKTLEVTVSNAAQVQAALGIDISGPFTVVLSSVVVPPQGSAKVAVSYSAIRPLTDTGVLTVGPLHVNLLAKAKNFGGCPPLSCTVQTFDADAGVCVSGEVKPDGTACGENLCTSSNRPICMGGQCVPVARPAGVACGDTWVTHAPPGRNSAEMAYDPVHQKVILFGGYGGFLFTDTWQWDGATWTQLFPATTPPGREAGVMTWDSARQRLVMFGGDDNTDTWEWDGTDWSQRLPAHFPPSRISAGFAFDSDRGRAVLVGGGHVNPPSSMLNDTWEWDGTDWTSIPVPFGPGGGAEALAYDPVKKQMVLFSGVYARTYLYDGTQYLEQTPAHHPPAQSDVESIYDSNRQKIVLWGVDGIWEWDGSDWSKPALSNVPPGRIAAGFAFDEARAQAVLFGGAYQQFRGDTWLYDGGTWSPSPPLPEPRVDPALAYDSARQRAVLFGGSQSYPVDAGVTWEFDGAKWQQIATTGGPDERTSAGIAYDENRQVTVLFGGQSTLAYFAADTWEWDGVAWTQKLSAHSPSGRYLHAMAYDRARQTVVLFGGQTISSFGGAADTWEWDGNDWTQLQPATSPPGRTDAAMVFDDVEQQLLLFGGSAMEMGLDPLSDLWGFVGGTWVQLPNGPPPRVHPGFVYDSRRGKAVLFGGQEQFSATPDLWDYAGGLWTQRMPQTNTTATNSFAMVYDEARENVVLFGGAAIDQTPSSDTWFYLPP